MPNIELRNENGKLVGYDTETGEKIPVSFESVSTDELSTRRYLKSPQNSRALSIGTPKPIPGQRASIVDDTNWSTSGLNSTITLDSATNCLEITNGGSGHAGAVYDFDTETDLTDLWIDFAANIETPTDQNLQFQVRYYEGDGSGGFTGDYIAYKFTREVGQGDGWIRVHPGISGETGAPNIENILRIQIRIDDPGVTCTWNLRDIRFIEGAGEGRVLWFFDDNEDSAVTTALPILNEYNQNAAMSVITGAVGESGHTSLSQLQEWYEDGNAITNHTTSFSQIDADNLSVSEWEANVREAKRYLLGDNPDGYEFLNGQTGLVLPAGDWKQDHLDVVDKYHDVCFGAGNSELASAGRAADPLQIPRGNGGETNLQDVITVAAKYNATVIPFLHGIGSNGDLTESEFETVVSHIDSTDGIRAISYQEFVRDAIPRTV